ncbi:MAG: hypothetical protein ACREBE_11490, partial [bacterium]
MIRRVIGSILCALSAARSVGAQPRLVLAVPSTSVAAYDSIYGVTAQAYDALGRRSTSSTITWRV